MEEEVPVMRLAELLFLSWLPDDLCVVAAFVYLDGES